MTSGTRPRPETPRGRRAACLALLLAWIGAPAGAAGTADWTLPALMQRLAQHPAGEVRFTETKKLAVLDTPVTSSGRLVYSPPDRLEKHILTPRAESLVVERDQLSMTRDGRTRTMRLSQYPELMSIIEAIRGTLVGNQALLAQHYTLALAGTEQDWRLTLSPLDERLQRWVRQITVVGRRNTVSRIETLQANGDSSVLEIE